MKYFSLARVKNEIFNAKTSARVTALSFALGVALAFSPFPGLHLIFYFMICRAFRLNGVVLLVGVLVHNPWTMIPIHLTGLMLGDLILHGNLESVAQFRLFPWKDFGLSTLVNIGFWKMNGPILLGIYKPFFIGHSIMSACCGSLTYFSVFRLMRKQPHQGDPT